MPADRILQWSPVRGLLDFIYPPLCLGCGEFHDSEDRLCGQCLRAIDRFECALCLDCLQPLNKQMACDFCGEFAVPLFAYGEYCSPLSDIIGQFKFRGITSPATVFARWIAASFGEQLASLGADALVPIPLHRYRETQRGYNQAKILADRLSPLIGLPVSTGVLYRVKKGRPQARLGSKQRARNIRNAFAAEHSSAPKKVILVDDVVTSGATMREAVRTLKAAGHKVAGAIAVAHGSGT